MALEPPIVDGRVPQVVEERDDQKNEDELN
jgi:hypothetical protein